MTMTIGPAQLPSRSAAPASQVAPLASPRSRRIDHVTLGLLVGVGASAAFAGLSALALAALG